VTAAPSPDGQFILVQRVQRPYSWLVPYRISPHRVEVWDRQGASVKQVAQLPVADNVPNGGVLPGPRNFQWQPLAPATLVWAEALDNGDPKTTVPHRDKVMTMSAPFTAAPSELARTEYRVGNLSWTDGGAVLLTENDRARRWTRTWVIDQPGAAPRKLWDRSQEDSYGNPGTPQQHDRASGRLDHPAERQRDFPRRHRRRAGRRASRSSTASTSPRSRASACFRPPGVRTRRCSASCQTMGRRSSRATRRANVPPNVYVRDLKAGTRVALTVYQDPAPQLKGIQKQLVTYKRNDGVELSATLITPPGWTPAQGPLPTLLWAYPREFTDPPTAARSPGSPIASRRSAAPRTSSS
jgi:dipeptidyl aminopeptidase/acylaminoacyl peptidase